MNKLLLTTLLLSTSYAQSHHLPARVSTAAPGALHGFRTESALVSDPETQIGNGVVPGIVGGVSPDDGEPEIEPEVEPDVGAETLPQ